jgi:hypothetical protein
MLFCIYLQQVGVVSVEKLLELLELAIEADTAKTVRRSRKLMDSGVDLDPMVLMSQLVGLIMDIIAGSYAVVDTKPDGSFVGDRSCECNLSFHLIGPLCVLFIIIFALI